MKTNILLLCILLLGLSFIFIVLRGANEFDDVDVIEQIYNTKTYDVLVPTLCVESVESKLSFMNLKKGVDYVYREFIGVQDAYKNINGYVSLMVNNNRSMDEILRLSVELTSQCYADTSISIPRTGNEWLHLEEELNDLKSKSVQIHSIILTEQYVKLFVNTQELSKIN